VWGGIAVAAPEVLTLAVGVAHAGVVAPLLLALVPLGLVQALTMPLTQALTAKGAAGLVLRRAALTGALSVLLGGLALWIDAVVATAGLSLAAVLVTLFYVPEALARLGQSRGMARVAVAPLLAGVVMAVCLGALAPVWAEWPVALRLVAKITLGTALFTGLVALTRARPRLVTP
jgi:hypothetical protein